MMTRTTGGRSWGKWGGVVAVAVLGLVTLATAPRPVAPKPAPDLTLVVLSSSKTPVAGVQVVVIDNSVETVYKSAGMRSVKPGDLLVRGRTDEKGELAVEKVKASSYAYEAGDPTEQGYANGQFEVKDEKKPMRVEIVLSEPVRP